MAFSAVGFFLPPKIGGIFLFVVVLTISDGRCGILAIRWESSLSQMTDDISQHKGRSPKQPQSFFFIIILYYRSDLNFSYFSAIAILFIEDDSPLG